MKWWMMASVVFAVVACNRLEGPAQADRLMGDGYNGRVARAEMRAAAPMFSSAPADSAALRHTDNVLAPATTMVIRNGTAAIAVDSIDPALSAIRLLATRVGGYIGNTSLQGGEGQLREATLEIKMPAARFDDALTGLRPIGKVEAVNITTADVGEEYVDVTARMDNARRLEQRLLGLLANRAGRLKDVLDVERSLAEVREGIERYQGRLMYLRAHSATSSLAITVHEHAPLVGPVGESVMGEAFAQAWRHFVWLAALVVESLGVVLPLGLVATGAWLVWRRYRTATHRPETA